VVVVPAYSLLTAYASHLLLGARFFRERKKDGVDNNEKETKWRVWKLVGRALIQIGGGGAYLPILFFVISTLYFLGGSNNADSVVPLGFVSVLGAGATTSSFQKLPEGPIVLCLSKTSLTCAFLLSTVPSI
jgi:hypothetical protein